MAELRDLYASIDAAADIRVSDSEQAELDISKNANNISSLIDTFVIRNASCDALIKDFIYADSTNASFTITLPATPPNNSKIKILDVATSFLTNNVTLDGNGNDIMGNPTYILSEDNKYYQLIYTGTEWRVY